MEKEVNISTNRRVFFQQYLRVIKPFLKPYLSNGELSVLGELMYHNDKYKDLDPKIKKKLLLDYDTKVDIMSNLGISQNTLANVLTKLRQSGYLADREISKALNVTPDKSITIKFKFNIDEEK
jgi:hypothetical protein